MDHVTNGRKVAQAISDELTGIKTRPDREGDAIPNIAELDDLPKLDDLRLLGVAFSGGGIRSATFNLGALHALERLGLLKYVDYLSTVSGGGYIGSWYLACLKAKLESGDKRAAALGHLRKFSQYLAPEAGFFSADTWTIIAIWIRNTLLLQTMLVSLFAIALLAPRLYEWAFLNAPLRGTLFASVALLMLSLIVIVRCLRQGDRSSIGQGGIQVWIVWPALAGAACLSSVLWRLRTGPPELRILTLDWTWFLVVIGVLVGLSAWWTARASLLPEQRTPAGESLAALSGVLGGALFTGLGFALGRLFVFWNGLGASGAWLAGLVGGPAVLTMFGLTVILKIGLLGRAIDDGSREWWARLGAFLTIYSFGPLALSAIVLFGPQVVTMLTSGETWQQWMGGTVTLGGILTTIGGVLAGKSSDTSDGRSSRVKEILAMVAPYVFIVGLLVLVATALHYILRNAPGCGDLGYWPEMNCSIGVGRPWVWMALVATSLSLALLARRIDINEASMNPFYRNRLVRCYLGAARAETRKPHPFTGFDTQDDFALASLSPASGYHGPVPIINAALSLLGGNDAGLQERRAASFFFTPYMSGSNWTGTISTKKISRYDDGIRVGACMATSGAAASPNMGYHTSPPTAFLMTFFNVRLGSWIRNPLAGEGKQSARWGFLYLLKELFTSADATDSYIYLSDGGHFENLGIYELVRRRCRYIIACDAEADGGMTLHGLGSVVRKCRIDFGVEITIDTSDLRARDAQGRSRAHCAVGEISYPKAGPLDGEPQYEKGYLIYVKSSLTGDEGSDVLQYQAGQPAFPHESTGDQFFTESQFESYRDLGRHVVQFSFRSVGGARPEGTSGDWPVLGSRRALDGWMKTMKSAWEPASPFTHGNFARHAEELTRVWKEIRNDDSLAFLDAELFPGWSGGSGPAASPGAVGRRKGLYLCQSLIQLMENIYLDLEFETAFDHPDNRGWKELFTGWAKSPLLKETYARSKGAYGTRFQVFCERELGL